jgi:ATP-dependent helicase/nuclease subunit B
VACGIPGSAAKQEAELLAFAQLLQAPRITLLRRRSDGDELLSASPVIERLMLALRRQTGRQVRMAADALVQVAHPTLPVPRPLPTAPHLLPARLSASACEALRACPYRFFALRLLKLQADEELAIEVEKRDYGTWLHEVLLAFHSTRSAPEPAAAEVARLHAVALDIQREHGLNSAEFLPFMASFERFAGHYVKWLHARDAQGAQWLDGEREFTATPADWGGTEMHGVIDRVDSAIDDTGPVIQLIDYKTGSAQALRETLKTPQEDTQLAFYAALMLAQSEAIGNVGAMYLALDDAKGIQTIEHPDVEATAQRLVEGIGIDLSRLRGGAGMPALGEGMICEHCDARGLCRRDHWPVSPEAMGGDPFGGGV